MKKIFALTLLLLISVFSVCQASLNKTYDDRQSRAIVRATAMEQANDIDPESTILINLKKIYFFDSRFYDNASSHYVPRHYFTIALLGNAAEKFDKIMNYSVNGSSYSLPISVETRLNNKKQVVLSAGTCEFATQSNNAFMTALKNGTPITITIRMKAKGNNLLKYTIAKDTLKDLGEVVNYDLYNDQEFLAKAKKASHKPTIAAPKKK